MRDDAAPARAADLPRRIADPDHATLPDASAASAAPRAGHLPGWFDGPGRDELPDAAASAPGSAAARTLRRTRLKFRRPALTPPAFFLWGE